MRAYHKEEIMAKAVVAGATIKCTNAVGMSSFVPQPGKVRMGGAPVGNIQQSATSNIPPIGMCTSLTNPQVAAATAAAFGVLTPQPCVPMLPGNPWLGCSSKVRVGGVPPLTKDGCLTCMWGGSITITDPGQQKVSV